MRESFIFAVNDQHEYSIIQAPTIFPNLVMQCLFLMQNLIKFTSSDLILRLLHPQQAVNFYDNPENTYFFAHQQQKIVILERLFFETNQINTNDLIFSLNLATLKRYHFDLKSIEVSYDILEKDILNFKINNRPAEYASSKFLYAFLDELAKHFIIAAESMQLDLLYARIAGNGKNSRIITTSGRMAQNDIFLSSFMPKEKAQ